MRRPLAAVLAATVLLGTAVIVTPGLSSATTLQRDAVHPHVAPVTTPTKGIAITMGFGNELTDAKAMIIANQLFSYVSKTLHANAVSLNFPFWQASSISNDPMRQPMTSSPQRLMAITAIAHHYHLSVQWRPFLFESDLTYQTHDSIKPTDPNLWLKNYWTFLQPYLEAANLAGASSFSIALELRTMLPYLSGWTNIVRRAKSLFNGQIFYSQQHLPQVSLPLTVRGYDAYQPIDLKTAKDLSVGALTGGFIHNLHASEMQQSPSDLTLEEVSIPAVPYAYLRPSHFHYAPTVKMDRPVQVDWFKAACNTFYQLHLQGIYYYGIAFDRYTPNENQSASVYGWLGTASAAAIAQCFSRTTASSLPAAAGLASRASVAPMATSVAWSAAQRVETTGGHPTSISCPTAAFCAEVDLGGDVLTETSGTWSAPLNIDQAGLVSISCTSATFCLALDQLGDAFSFDGTTWTESLAVDSVPMTSVSCAPGTATCVAVDVAGNSLTYSSGTWSGPTPVKAYPLTEVSCASVSFCVAVDVAGYAHTFNGTWGPAHSLGTSTLTSVACASSTFCVVGSDTGRLYSDASGVWSSQSGVLAGGAISVSCASTSRCLAIGDVTSAGINASSRWTGAGRVFTGDGGVSVSCAPFAPCTAVSFAGQVTTRAGRWSSDATNDARPGNLTSIGCGSTSFCMAVDDTGAAMTWNGSTWTSPAPTGLASLSGVSCVGTFCAAVSNSGAAIEYDNGTWSAPRTVDTSALTAVSCTSTAFCAATDASNHVLTYNGTTWSHPSTEGVPQTMVRGYVAVSCIATKFCVAVDTDGSELFFGSVTPLLYQADTHFVPLTSIACASTSLCVAVDEQGNAITYSVGSGKSTWTTVHIDAYRLTAVACTPAGYCLATDDHGGTVAFNGTTWSTASRSVPLGAISAVACTGTTTCVATDKGDAAASTATL